MTCKSDVAYQVENCEGAAADVAAAIAPELAAVQDPVITLSAASVVATNPIDIIVTYPTAGVFSFFGWFSPVAAGGGASDPTTIDVIGVSFPGGLVDIGNLLEGDRFVTATTGILTIDVTQNAPEAVWFNAVGPNQNVQSILMTWTA